MWSDPFTHPAASGLNWKYIKPDLNGSVHPQQLWSEGNRPFKNAEKWSNRFLTWTSSLQGGEYGTDEEEDEDEEVSPPYPSAIEVFDLAENEDMSPLETDPEKLAHKYKEVMGAFLSV